MCQTLYPSTMDLDIWWNKTCICQIIYLKIPSTQLPTYLPNTVTVQLCVQLYLSIQQSTYQPTSISVCCTVSIKTCVYLTAYIQLHLYWTKKHLNLCSKNVLEQYEVRWMMSEFLFGAKPKLLSVKCSERWPSEGFTADQTSLGWPKSSVGPVLAGSTLVPCFHHCYVSNSLAFSLFCEECCRWSLSVNETADIYLAFWLCLPF